MLWQRTVGVVVPAYEAEGLVGEVIATMPSLVDRVYVVDDASPDGTWNEILEHAENDGATAAGRVVPLRHDRPRGVGGAVKTGYKRALADGMDVTVVMGGDGRMDPDYLTDLVAPIISGHAEYTKADRLQASEYRAATPWRRWVGNAILSGLTRVASGYWRVSDPQNGYTAISLQALEAIDIDIMYEDYGYCNDLLVKLNVEGMRVADVPVSTAYGAENTDGDTSSPEDIWRVSWLLVRNFLWRLHRKYVTDRVHPLVVCYALGGWLLWTSPFLMVADVVSPLTPLVLVGFGLVFLVAAAELDRRENRRLEVTLDV